MGFRSPAQGCPRRGPTLGNPSPKSHFNRNAVAPAADTFLCPGRATSSRLIQLIRAPKPNVAPGGATLGLAPQRRWR